MVGNLQLSFLALKKKQLWKCKEGHNWVATIKSRSIAKTGCPTCVESGFSPDKPAWFYLMKRGEEQQFGITNHIEDRMKYHARQGWEEIDKTGLHDGYEVQKIEEKLKQWLKKRNWSCPG